MFLGKIEESEKASSCQKANPGPGHLACAATALSLSYDNQTITSPIYMYCTGGTEMPQFCTQQPREF